MATFNSVRFIGTGVVIGTFLLGAGLAQAATFSTEFGVGTQDQDVINLQTWLTDNGYYSGPITGYYGTLTQAGVERFQSAQGITATGFVGPLTLAALNNASANAGVSGTTSVNSAEIAALEAQLNSLLAQIQALEASGGVTTTTVTAPAPVAGNISVIGNEGVSIGGTLSASGNGPYTYTITGYPTYGSISSFNTGTGSYVYTPNSNYSGNDTFTYTVGNGYATSSPYTVTIDVQPSSNTTTTSSAPSGQAFSFQTSGGASYSSNLSASGTGPYLYQIESAPMHGVVANFSSTTGAYTYVPTTGYIGSDSFTYVVGNGEATSSPYTVTITNNS